MSRVVAIFDVDQTLAGLVAAYFFPAVPPNN